MEGSLLETNHGYWNHMSEWAKIPNVFTHVASLPINQYRYKSKFSLSGYCHFHRRIFILCWIMSSIFWYLFRKKLTWVKTAGISTFSSLKVTVLLDKWDQVKWEEKGLSLYVQWHCTWSSCTHSFSYQFLPVHLVSLGQIPVPFSHVYITFPNYLSSSSQLLSVHKHLISFEGLF